MSQPADAGAGSVSKVSCTLQVRGKGQGKLVFYRHMAPLTVNALLRVLPLESRVNIQSAMVSLFTQVRVGAEKPRATLERGEVAFLPSGALLCIFLKNASSDRPLNPVGKVEEGIDLLDGLRAGDSLRIEQNRT